MMICKENGKLQKMGKKRRENIEIKEVCEPKL